MIELTIWDYGNIITKFFIYLGVSAAIGGMFITALINPVINKKLMTHYIVLTSTLGFVAVIVNFFIQVGAFSEAGLSGMFDPDMSHFLWQSALGDSVLWRLLAFTLLGGGLFFGGMDVWYKRDKLKHALFAFLYIVAIIAFAYSFTLVGHSRDSGGIARWLIGFHIVTMAWWMGALYPLWLSCSLLKPPVLYRLMNLFGKIAAFMVALLIACGIGLLFIFFATPLAMFTTAYGQAVLLKLIFVVTILLIAAYHKFHLVEEIQQENGIEKLQKSIKNEMLIALVILSITAVLSSVLGPNTLSFGT